jgi:hypothetical protein
MIDERSRDQIRTVVKVKSKLRTRKSCVMGIVNNPIPSLVPMVRPVLAVRYVYQRGDSSVIRNRVTDNVCSASSPKQHSSQEKSHILT